MVLLFLTVSELRAQTEKFTATFIEPNSIDITIPGKELLEFNSGILIDKIPTLRLGVECALTKRFTIDICVGLQYSSPIVKNIAAEASYLIVNKVNAIVVGALEVETVWGDTNNIATELAIGYVPKLGALSIPSKMHFGLDFTKNNSIAIEPEFGIDVGPFYSFRYIQIGIPVSLTIEDEKTTIFTGIETDLNLPHDIVFVSNVNFSLLHPFMTPRMFLGYRFDF